MKKIILSVFLTSALVWLLLSNIEIDKAVSIFKSIPPLKIVWLLLVYGIYLKLTSLRFHVLLHSKNIKFGKLLIITAMHNMYNRVLPFRTGEVSYILLLRSTVDGTEAAASLLVARIFDYLTISFLFVVTVLFMDISGKLQLIAGVMALFMTAAFGILVTLTFAGGKFLDRLQTLFLAMGVENNKLLQKVDVKGREIVKSLQLIGNKKTYGITFLLSSLIWFTMFYIHYSIIVEVGGTITSYFSTIIGSTFAVLTNVLPIHGVAGFGTIETGWTVGYMLLGVSKQAAIASGFLMHIFVLFSALIYGLVGLIFNTGQKFSNK